MSYQTNWKLRGHIIAEGEAMEKSLPPVGNTPTGEINLKLVRIWFLWAAD